MDPPAADERVWRGTQAADMEDVEKNMQCPICQELLDGASTLSPCGHAFCAECVRRALARKGECPSCRKPCTSSDLHPNKSLDAVVRAYSRARRALMLAVGLSAAAECVPSAPPEPVESAAEPRVSKRMPHLVYHMTKDKDLRAMLKELGLPTKGAKETLVFRHKEYALLFNSLLDKAGGVTRREAAGIAKQVLRKEKTLESSKSAPSLFTGAKGGGRTEALDRLESLDSFRQSFRDLVRQILDRESEFAKHAKVRERVGWRKPEPAESSPLEGVSGKAKRKASTSASSKPTNLSEKRVKAEGYQKAPEDRPADSAEAGPNSGDWRRVYSARCDAVIYFNTKTREAVVGEPPAGALAQDRVPSRSVIDLDAEQDDLEAGSAAIVAASSSSARGSVSGSGAGPWACSVCTFLNPDGAGEKCEVCESARPGLKRGVPDGNARRGRRRPMMQFFKKPAPVS